MIHNRYSKDPKIEGSEIKKYSKSESQGRKQWTAPVSKISRSPPLINAVSCFFVKLLRIAVDISFTEHEGMLHSDCSYKARVCAPAHCFIHYPQNFVRSYIILVWMYNGLFRVCARIRWAWLQHTYDTILAGDVLHRMIIYIIYFEDLLYGR